MNEKKNLTTEETFALAVQNHQKNNLQVARNLYKKILKINPDHFESIFYLGSLSLQTKNFDQAKPLLQKAIKIQPNFARAHNNLGMVFKELGEFQKGMSYFQKAIEIQPNFANAHYNLGIAFNELNEFEKAISFYEKAIQISPNYVAAYNNLGLVFHELNEFEKAINCYEKAIQINPNFENAYNNLGAVFRELKEHQKAISCYEKAIQINPNYVDAYNNLGIIFKELGELQKAVDCHQKAIQIQPDDAYAHYNLGLIFTGLGELQKAADCYQKVIQIQPDRVEDAHVGLGLVFKELGEYQKAKSCYEKAIQIQPNYADAYNNLGVVFDELGEHQKAIGCYEKAIQINPNYINAYNNLGVVFDELGEHQKAIGCCEKALQIQPQNFKTHDAIINIKWENNYGNKSFIDLFNYIEEINEPPLDLVDLLLDGLIQTSQKDLLINLKNILKKKTPHNLGYKLRQATIDSTELIGNYENALKILTEISKSPNNTIIDTERLEFKISKMHFYVGKAKEALIFLNRLSKTNDHNFLQEILSFKAHVLKYLKDDDYFNLCDYDRFLFAQELQTPNRWKNLNSFNLDLAKELEKLHVHKKHPYDQTLRNGTQTLGSLFANKNYKYKCIFELKNLFDKAIQKYIKKLNYNDEHPFLKYIPSSINISGSWSISLNNGGFHINHFHPEGWLSSVYYVSLPDTLDKKGKSKQGWLKFGEPTHNKYNLLPDKWVQPKVGLLVLFPSYFWHGTEPFQSNENRLTVAFDAK